jgi:hypothetical protein
VSLVSQSPPRRVEREMVISDTCYWGNGASYS